MGFFDIYETSIVEPIKFNEHISFEFKSKIKFRNIDYSKFISTDLIFSRFNFKQQYLNMDDLIVAIGNIDPRTVLKNSIELNTYFECPFGLNSLGWFSPNSKNKIRYFSKYKEQIVYLDTLDILQFLLKCNDTSSTLNLIIKKFKIVFISDSWISYQRIKYMNNFNSIHSIYTNDNFKQDYPALSTLIFPCLKLYETLNVIGNIHLGKKEYIYKGNNIFFVSNAYIAKFCQIHQSTVNRMINLLCCLNIIHKVPKNCLNNELLDNSKKIARKNQVKDTISYYSIPCFEDICNYSEQVAIKLYYGNINHTNITKNLITNILDDDIIKKVYTNSKINEDLNEINYDFLLNIIRENIHSKGFCSKYDIEYRIKRDLNKKLTWRIIKDTLIEKCLNINIKYVKPTQEIKSILKLSSSNYIFTNI